VSASIVERESPHRESPHPAPPSLSSSVSTLPLYQSASTRSSARGPRPARLASACVSWQSSTSLRPRLYAFLRSALAAGRVPHAHMHTPTHAHTEMRMLSLSPPPPSHVCSLSLSLSPSLSRAYENAYACARGTAQTRPRGNVASLYLPRPSIIDTPYQHDLQSSRGGGFLSPGHVISTSFYESLSSQDASRLRTLSELRLRVRRVRDA
jgi:hypothetical protein